MAQAKEDIKENEMQELQTVDYIRGIIEKNSGVISINGLIGIVLSGDTNELPPNTDFNDLKLVGGVYNLATGPYLNSPKRDVPWSILIVFSGYSTLQIFIEKYTFTIYARVYNGTNKWGEWKEISFT